MTANYLTNPDFWMAFIPALASLVYLCDRFAPTI